ncbi:hypothetical protein AALP_AAs73848U000100, partial [Arabis alpina]
DYALEMKLISKSDQESFKEDYAFCQNSTKLCNLKGGLTCHTAYGLCEGMFSGILLKLEDTNYYDVRKKCVGSLCYDFSNMEKFL